MKTLTTYISDISLSGNFYIDRICRDLGFKSIMHDVEEANLSMAVNV